MNLKGEKGITLIALVITIIVLLILAGVTISMVLGDEGIIQNAQQAKEQHTEKTIEETIELAYLTHRTRDLAEPTYDEDLEDVIEEALVEAFGKREKVDGSEEKYVGDDSIITFDNGEVFYLDEENGTVIKLIKFTIKNQVGTIETYYAKPGMTWLDWANDKKFDLDKFKLAGTDEPWIVTNNGCAVCTKENGYWHGDGVRGSEDILENGFYYIGSVYGKTPEDEI